MSEPVLVYRAHLARVIGGNKNLHTLRSSMTGIAHPWPNTISEFDEVWWSSWILKKWNGLGKRVWVSLIITELYGKKQDFLQLWPTLLSYINHEAHSGTVCNKEDKLDIDKLVKITLSILVNDRASQKPVPTFVPTFLSPPPPLVSFNPFHFAPPPPRFPHILH